MQRLNLLTVGGGGARGRRKYLIVTQIGRIAAGQLGIPLLGAIPAGKLREALAQPESFVEPNDLLSYEPGDFLLIVEGESMVGDSILPGDMVLLRPDVVVQQGEIAAVHVGTDYQATLKHVYVDALRCEVTLRASNPAFEDRVVSSEDVRIAGVYRGLVRGPIRSGSIRSSQTWDSTPA